MHFQRKGRLHGWKWRPPSIQVKPLRIESLKHLKHSITQEMERIFQLQDLIPSLNHKSVEIQDILDKFWNHQRIKKSYRESSSMNLLKWRMVCCFFLVMTEKTQEEKKKNCFCHWKYLPWTSFANMSSKQSYHWHQLCS